MDNFDLKKYLAEGKLHQPSNLNENLKQDSYYLPLNQQIRIPANIEAIIQIYNAINGVI